MFQIPKNIRVMFKTSNQHSSFKLTACLFSEQSISWGQSPCGVLTNRKAHFKSVYLQKTNNNSVMYKLLLLASCLYSVLCGWAKQYNWTKVGGITPAQDQGSCAGACTCFAVTLVYQTEYWRQTGNLIPLSTEYCLETTEATCDSSSITHKVVQNVMKSVANTGLPRDSDYPYTAGSTSTGEPSTNGISGASRVQCSKKVHYHHKHKAGKSTLKHWIAKNPTVNMVDTTDNQLRDANSSTSSSDPYECKKNNPDDKQLNHVLNAVGYDHKENWIVQSSWGTGWANNGQLLLKKGKECGLRRRIYRYNWAGRMLGMMVAMLMTVMLIAF